MDRSATDGRQAINTGRLGGLDRLRLDQLRDLSYWLWRRTQDGQLSLSRYPGYIQCTQVDLAQSVLSINTSYICYLSSLGMGHMAQAPDIRSVVSQLSPLMSSAVLL